MPKLLRFLWILLSLPWRRRKAEHEHSPGLPDVFACVPGSLVLVAPGDGVQELFVLAKRFHGVRDEIPEQAGTHRLKHG
ncbi:hypothetical protein [Pseudarthrobacter sp. TAF60_1]|uniref:hypothetical protein n=1 Tax=Pseudarthrobacter sp. TAF60_1 TaxID=3233071 RepID=UPI003F9A93D1